MTIRVRLFPLPFAQRARPRRPWSNVTAIAGLLLALIVGALVEPRSVVAGPTSLPAAQSSPELDIQLTNTGLNVPQMMLAGQVLVTFENASSLPAEVVVARLPANLTLQAALDPASASSLPWLLGATYPGSPGVAAPGQQTAAVVRLAPGQYVAFTAGDNRPYTNDPQRRMAGFVVVEATGPMVPIVARADGSIALTDGSITVPERISPGRHIWQITNNGMQLHEVQVLRAPHPLTVQQVQAALDTREPGQSPPGGLTYQALVNLPVAGGMSWLSPGQSAFAEVNLTAGNYVMLDFTRTPATGLPHALFGMVAVITVG